MKQKQKAKAWQQREQNKINKFLDKISDSGSEEGKRPQRRQPPKDLVEVQDADEERKSQRSSSESSIRWSMLGGHSN